MQTFKVGNRNLNVEQMRAYRDGKFDPRTMKYKDAIVADDTKDEIAALRDVKNTPEVSTQPDAVETPENEAGERTEDVESPLVSELEENQKLRAEFDKLKEVGYQKLKKPGKDRYKELKTLLNL